MAAEVETFFYDFLTLQYHGFQSESEIRALVDKFSLCNMASASSLSRAQLYGIYDQCISNEIYRALHILVIAYSCYVPASSSLTITYSTGVTSSMESIRAWANQQLSALPSWPSSSSPPWPTRLPKPESLCQPCGPPSKPSSSPSVALRESCKATDAQQFSKDIAEGLRERR